jgi:hypothetical protein
MSHQAKLPIPKSAVTGRFVDVQKTFPLSAAEAKKLDAFLKGYNQTHAMKVSPSEDKRVVAKKRVKAKRRRTLAPSKG